MLIDATSGAGGLPVDVSQTRCLLLAPQKSFASDGGLWLALMSPKALERAESIGASDRWIPAVLRPADRHRQLAQEPDLQHPVGGHAVPDGRAAGLDERPGRARGDGQAHDGLLQALYGWAERTSYTTPYVANPEHRSLVIGTIDFDEAIDADAIAAATLRANDVVDTEPYRKLGRNQLRIAMYPAIDPSDVQALTECVDYVVERLRA